MTTVRRSRRRAALTAPLVALGLVASLGLAGCSGDDESPSSNSSADADGDDEVTPEEVLAFAKEQLDSTSGVTLSLATDDSPDADAFLKRAEGTITTAPAFEGTAEGTFNGITAEVKVIAVDGKFYVELPVVGWDELDPESICAPDPAQLLDPGSGVSNVLTAAEDPQEGESQRAASDNELVITPYTATVPGDAIKNILPCAPGDSFDATFSIDGDGRLREAELTGEFFSGVDDLTYTISISEYDVTKEISAP
jgi:lipoprotein LprG